MQLQSRLVKYPSLTLNTILDYRSRILRSVWNYFPVYFSVSIMYKATGGRLNRSSVQQRRTSAVPIAARVSHKVDQADNSAISSSHGPPAYRRMLQVRMLEILFLSANFFHDLTVNLRYFAGDFYVHPRHFDFL